MAVAALVDGPVVALLEALEGVRTTPPPVGQEAARVAALAHASAELRGVFLRELGAVSPQEHGARSAADLLEQHGGVPAWQARRDAGLAGRLARVPGLADAVAGGALELDAALLLVRAWQALPSRLQDDELARALVTLGQLVDLRDLRAKVDELLSALAPEVTDDDLADAREAAELTLVDVGATTRWEGTSDALSGELAREVLIKKAEGLRAADETRTGPQLLMAALTALLEEATTDDTPGSPGLLVITDVDDLARTAEAQPDRAAPDDAVASLFEGTDLLPGSPAPARPSWGSRSRGGVPVGPRTLAALACRSVLTRLVLSPLGHPLDSSPQARQISPRERSALEHRAGYRCERAGCGRPARNCVPHHVVPWALGGPSTQANTVLLCVSCHHLLHDRLRPLLLTSGFRIGPRGWLDTSPPDDPPVL
ncbi:MAG: putative endonuclease [Frankiales bacterium]|nr:putative endonuclease [Frankiales bacterium]